MTSPLLSTKLFTPSPRAKLVSRPRLVNRLNAGLQNRLTLISAPAGFGKSTALSSWISDIDYPVAWLSLDEGDNELAQFLSYFVAALQTINTSLGRGAAVALQSPDGFNPEILLTSLLNEITDTHHDMVIILDDYHLIESQPVDNALIFIMDHLPRQMHLFISSRIDPSFPLSRLRASGYLIELRAEDLRFSNSETAVFLNQVMDLDLSSQELDSLEARTEGWIIGLHLAASALKGLEDQGQVKDFIDRFTGSDRYIQDYLTEEVLKQQPKEIKDFLLKTSILQRMSSSLCNAVTQNTNSQAVLEELESGNLFIVPLDNTRHWYRYHHLFADLLAHNLSVSFPDQIPELHQRASSWFEANDLLDQAIAHAQSAGSVDKVALIIEDHWQEYIHRGELAKLRSWLDSLNPAYTKNSAPLSMAYCWINVMTRNFKPLPSYVKDICAVIEPIAAGEVLEQPNKIAVIPSLVETVEAVISLDNNQPQKAESHALRAISIIPENLDPITRELLQGAAGYWYAQALRALGQVEQACEVLLGVLEMLKSSENYYGAANTLGLITSMYQELGKTRLAILLCEETLRYNEEHHWGDLPPSGLVNVIYADLLVDAGDYEAAVENLEKGRNLVEQINSPPIMNMVASVEGKIGNTSPPTTDFQVPLTAREVEVLTLVSEGFSNRQIGERLFLSLDTVKGHNRKIYAKLGVKNRTQAVNKAVSLKLIPPGKTT